MAEKNKPLGIVKNLENHWKNNVLGRGGVARKNKSYGLAKTLKTLENNVLSTCIKWQEKTDPWSPAAHHEIARGTIKNIGKTMFWHMATQTAFTANWRWQIKKQPRI